jgi:hypothetical protein
VSVLSYPYSDPKWPGKALLGGLLLLLAPLLLPLLLALGYAVATARLAAGEGTGLPAWRPWGERLRDGALLLGSVALYGWPALLSLGTLLAGALVLGGPLTGRPVAGAIVWLAGSLQPVGLVWLLVAFLLFPLQLALQAGRQRPTPANLLRLARAHLGRLPRLWLRQALLALFSLSGLLLALLGLPFTAFWALLCLSGQVALLLPSARHAPAARARSPHIDPAA